MSKQVVTSKKVVKMQPKEAEPGTAWPPHLINAESRLHWEVSQAVEIAGDGLIGDENLSATGKALLALLSQVLYSFKTHAEHPEEYYLIRSRNRCLPIEIDVAADKADALSSSCLTALEAIHELDDDKPAKSLMSLTEALEKVAKAAEDFSFGAEIYPCVTQDLLAIENPYTNGEVGETLETKGGPEVNFE